MSVTASQATANTIGQRWHLAEVLASATAAVSNELSIHSWNSIWRYTASVTMNAAYSAICRSALPSRPNKFEILTHCMFIACEAKRPSRLRRNFKFWWAKSPNKGLIDRTVVLRRAGCKMPDANLPFSGLMTSWAKRGLKRIDPHAGVYMMAK